ncbi:MAG: DUF2281 domain-containing protein [Armatimonadota bacterium]|nr:DUF2281 domain-containing protein [Armatimonadota bacterium]
MTELLEKVFVRASQLPEAEQDAAALALLKTLEQLEQHHQPQSKPYRRAGSAEGLFVIPDDFDEPLEDFKEYM